MPNIVDSTLQGLCMPLSSKDSWVLLLQALKLLQLYLILMRFLGFVRMAYSSFVFIPKTWYSHNVAFLESLHSGWACTLISLHWNVTLALSLFGEVLVKTCNFILHLYNPEIDHGPERTFHLDFLGFFFIGVTGPHISNLAATNSFFIWRT